MWTLNPKQSGVHFCKLRTVNLDPVLLLNRTPIAVVEQVKFLGLIFDKQLSFILRLCHLKQKCLKAPNLLRWYQELNGEQMRKHYYACIVHLSNLIWTMVLLLTSHIFKCWNQYRITLFAFVLVHFEHSQSQKRYLWN